MSATTPAAAATAQAGDGCGAPDQAAPLPASVDLEKETVITGVVRAASGDTVAGAYVRLLDSAGEFTAEVVTSAAGQFRFFAAPGTWTVRALVPGATVDRAIVAEKGGVAEVEIAV
jgi:Protein of unknown function (DUF1416)